MNELSPYQEFLSHFTGEITEPEPPECEHDHVCWEPLRGCFVCVNPCCEEEMDIPELTDTLKPDLRKPYDLIIQL